MGLVIHGMSTALSTTITAIVSYALFGYFYTRLGDVQTHCLSGIEQLTSIYLLPRYVKSDDDILNTMSELIKSVILAANKLKQTQDTYHDTAITLQQTIAANSQQAEELAQIRHVLHEGFRQSIAANQQQADRLAEEQVQIRHLLREGFRLPTDRDDEQL